MGESTVPRVNRLTLSARQHLSRPRACARPASPGQTVAEAVRTALRGRGTLTAASAIAIAMSLSVPAHAKTVTTKPAKPSHTATHETTVPAQATLKEVVVTARTRAIMAADKIKMDAPTIVDSVVADQAGLLPDNSVSEVLQRVSGVTMVRFASLGDPDHFSDEGTAVQIRGLSDVASRLNGQEIFTATGGRGLSFQDIPPELLKAINVYKSVTANMIEGGAGGQIDLVTRMPFDFSPGLKLDATASANYGDLVKKTEPAVSFLASDRWRGPWGDFGALVDLAYTRLAHKDDFIRNTPYYKQLIGGTNYYIPAGYEYGYDRYIRDRKGAYVGLQWAPTDDLTISGTAFYSKYHTNTQGVDVFALSNYLVVNPANSTFDFNNALLSSPDLFTRNPNTFAPTSTPGSAYGVVTTPLAETNLSYSDTFDISGKVVWRPGTRWKVKAGYQMVSSVSNSMDNTIDVSAPPFTQGYGLTETSTQARVAFPASITAAYANPAEFYWHAHQDHLAHNDGQEHAVNLDVNYRISRDRFFRSVEAGARYSDRREQDADTGYNWAPFCEGWNGCATVPLSQADISAGTVSYQPFSDFFRGSVTLPAPVYLPSFALVGQYNTIGEVAKYGGQVTTATYLDGSPFIPFHFGPGDYSLASSYDGAGFVMVNFGDDNSVLPFSGNVGVRYVQLSNHSSGYFKQAAVSLPGPTGTNTSTLVFPSVYYFRSGGSVTRRALPSINIRLMPAPNFFIRGAYTVTMDEPSFYDLRATGSDGASVSSPSGGLGGHITGYTSNTGNPDLRPMVSHNWDLAFQWFPKRATEAHLDFFYKTLNDTIVYGNTLQPIPFKTASGAIVTRYASASVDYNSPQSAIVKGVEIGGHTFFDMLPSPWNGLGLEANFTYIDSHNPGDEYVDISGVTHHNVPIVGLSKDNYNVVLMYQKPQWSARLAWSWRSSYLITTNNFRTSGTYPYYSAPGVFKTLDFSLPIYSAPYGELDFGLTYRPTKSLAVQLQFNNLTNETAKTLMGGYPNHTLYIRSWFTSDRRATLRVMYKFL